MKGSSAAGVLVAVGLVGSGREGAVAGEAVEGGVEAAEVALDWGWKGCAVRRLLRDSGGCGVCVR